MANSVALPPAGFETLPVEEKIDYVQSLWDHIAGSVDHMPLQQWQQSLLTERLEAHRRSPGDASPWREAMDRVEQRRSVIR